MKVNLQTLVSMLYKAFMDDPRCTEIGNRVEIARFNAYKNVNVIIYAYREYAGKKCVINLMLDARGASYDPIRYSMGVIAYDIVVSPKTLAATRRAYDYLLANGLRAHSDYLGID